MDLSLRFLLLILFSGVNINCIYLWIVGLLPVHTRCNTYMFQFDILDAAGAESIAVLYHYGVLNYCCEYWEYQQY